MAPHPARVPVATLLAVCASALLQLACAIRRGLFHPTAVMLLVGAGVLLLAAVRARGRVDARWLLAPILVVIAHGALFAMPLPLEPYTPTMMKVVPAVLGALALTYLVPVRPMIGHARFAAIVVLACALAANVFAASPRPPIDVFDLQTQGADDLLRGRDPYASVSVADTNDPDQRVPYTYMPVTLVATTLARATLGDIRWALLAALALAAVAARFAARRTAPDAPELAHDALALVMIGGPLTGFVLEEAWVDVVPLGLVCAAVWALAARRPTLAAILFGVGFVGKQPLVVGFPLLLLVPGLRRRELAIAAAAAAATVLPFFAWSPGAFWAGTVAYFAHLPARSDALTMSNLLQVRFHHAPGELLGASIAVLSCALVWKRAPRGAATLLLLLCFALLAIFLFGRLAFANYYFLLAGLAAAAAALAQNSPAAERAASASSGEQVPDRR